MRKAPEEWVEYCEKNQDWIKNYSKDKEVKKIFEELGIKKWFQEPIKNKNAMIHHLPEKKK